MDYVWLASVVVMLTAILLSNNAHYRYAGYFFIACFLAPEIIYPVSVGDITPLTRFKEATEYLLLSTILFALSIVFSFLVNNLNLSRYILASVAGMFLCLLFEVIAFAEYALYISSGNLVYFPYYEHMVIIYCLFNTYSIYMGGKGGRGANVRTSPFWNWRTTRSGGKDAKVC